MLIGFPFLLVKMPMAVRLRGLVWIFVFGTFMGAAVSNNRRRSGGRMEELSLLPLRGMGVVVDTLLAWIPKESFQANGEVAVVT